MYAEELCTSKWIRLLLPSASSRCTCILWKGYVALGIFSVFFRPHEMYDKVRWRASRGLFRTTDRGKNGRGWLFHSPFHVVGVTCAPTTHVMHPSSTLVGSMAGTTRAASVVNLTTTGFVVVHFDDKTRARTCGRHARLHRRSAAFGVVGRVRGTYQHAHADLAAGFATRHAPTDGNHTRGERRNTKSRRIENDAKGRDNEVTFHGTRSAKRKSIQDIG